MSYGKGEAKVSTVLLRLFPYSWKNELLHGLDSLNRHGRSSSPGAILGSIINYSSGYVKDQANQASNIAVTELISLFAGFVVDTSTNYVGKYTDLATYHHYSHWNPDNALA